MRPSFPIAMILAGLTMAGPSLADDTPTGDTTTGGHPACQEPHWLEAAVVQAEENERAYERYINTGKCIETREGMDISVVDRYGDADNRRVEFEFKGFRFFTVADAVASSL